MDPSKKTNSEALLKKLENLKISFNLVNHEPVTSCKEHSDALNNTNLAFCKNLLILNKKSKKLSLLVLPAASNFSFKQIGSVLGVNGNHLRLANDALLEETLKVARGALNPFSVMFDSDDRVELIIDKPIAKEKRLLAIHPMHNDASILVKFGDLKTFLEDLKFFCKRKQTVHRNLFWR
ncbi:hypothetical protein MHBO_001381 [Bonamia ostreae]|uniref:YbaK/aminoacyl-tRNA synthetase-associated domain-containing protein n=1 Tax=Bonamia ostreae TaxID=126728 RepID=A0ABV2AIU5_9EUKA